VDTSPESTRFAVLFQVLDIQVFNTDRFVGVNVPTGKFVQEIFLLVRDVVICLLQFLFCFLPVLRKALLSSNALLQLLDPVT